MKEFNKIIGSNVRIERIKSGKNQMEIATMLGITFQQIQKYEKGINRISAASLGFVAKFLDKPISVFYDDPDASFIGASNEKKARASYKLVNELMKIDDEKTIHLLINLVRNLSGASE